MTQKMISLAESLLIHGPTGGSDGIITDYIAAKLALEVAEQPDNAKHGLSETATMPDNGNHTYNIVITPGAPNGIGNGYAVLVKKENGTFLSQTLGVVDNVVTPIVDVAAFFQPEIFGPIAIALSAIQGAQDLANGDVLGGLLALAAAAAGGVAEFQSGIATSATSQLSQIANGQIVSDAAATAQLTHDAAAAAQLASEATLVVKTISITQGIIGAIEGAKQGNILAAVASAAGALGSAAGAFNQSLSLVNGGIGSSVLGSLSVDSQVVSGLAGAALAAGGGNVLQSLAALTSAAEVAGITPGQVEQALLSGFDLGASSSSTGVVAVVASSGTIASDFGSLGGSSTTDAAFALPLDLAKAADLLSPAAAIAIAVLTPTPLGGGENSYTLGNGTSFYFTPDAAHGFLSGTDALTGVPFTIPVSENLAGALQTTDGTVIGAVNAFNNAFLNTNAVGSVLASQAIAMAPVNLGTNIEGFSSAPPFQQLPGFEANIAIPTILATPSDNPTYWSSVPGFSTLPQAIATLGSILSTPADQSAGQLGIIFAARPTASQSEKNVGSFLGPGFTGQVSYLSGTVVNYGTPGSVRPDFSSADGMITYEVKNYNLNNISGMTTSIGDQAIQRAANLLPGAVQKVIIDVTGQTITANQKVTIYSQIESKSNGIIGPEQIQIIGQNQHAG